MIRIVTAVALLVLLGIPVSARGQARAEDFQLTSADIGHGAFPPAQIYNAFGCTGANISPQLSWTGAPAGTRSFVVTAFDPDAPTGSGFWHWVIVNIPAAVTSLPTGVSRTSGLPAGALETRTDFGPPGYGGPCPPAGDAPHRYIFTVHALKVDRLALDAQTSGAMVGFMVHSNTLGSASFTARFGR